MSKKYFFKIQQTRSKLEMANWRSDIQRSCQWNHVTKRYSEMDSEPKISTIWAFPWYSDIL